MKRARNRSGSYAGGVWWGILALDLSAYQGEPFCEPARDDVEPVQDKAGVTADTGRWPPDSDGDRWSQYDLSHSLWAADSSAFVYAAFDRDWNQVFLQVIDEELPILLGPGSMAAFSPVAGD